MSYAWWEAAKRGDFGPMTESDPQPGFYAKGKFRLPVAIWRDDAGEVVACVGSDDVDPVSVWMDCAKHPVTEEAYRGRIETGAWPDMPPPIGHNLPASADPFEQLAGEISDQVAAARLWLKGRTITGSDDADKAANWKNRLGALSKEADDERVRQKRPHDDAGKAVQAKFKPLVDMAEVAASQMAAALLPYLKAETARKAEGHKAKQAEWAAAQRVAEQSGAPVTAPKGPPRQAGRARVGGAVGARVSIRETKHAEITDYAATLQHFSEHDDVKALVQQLADRIVRAGGTVPGAKLKLEQVAA